MPPPFDRHLFVCTNRRPDGSPKGCCATKGADQVRLALKQAMDEAGLKGVRVNQAGCLDACERGVAVVVYPEGHWYQAVTPGDAKELVARALAKGEFVERLAMQPFERKKG